eukprot:TRINITY_DN23765_c0_g1_i1.p1 TRINITY_DN23765_c0_g1~~TRINITY_DN23765_c0_g1_i1.p1  ORF type:complete len:130 (-),score=15.29 TRINITY_DN23765_c0_g1_i1:423-812(-)
MFAAWVSFYFPKDVIAGRFLLLATLLLILVNIFNTVIINTPKSESLTAIQSWVLTCLLFVFGAFIEFAGILLRKQMRSSGLCKEKYLVNEATAEAVVFVGLYKFFLESVSLVCFCSSNIIYWFMLLTCE